MILYLSTIFAEGVTRDEDMDTYLFNLLSCFSSFWEKLKNYQDYITFWVTIGTALISLATFLFLITDRITNKKKIKYAVNASKLYVNKDKFYILCEISFKNLCPRPVSIFDIKLYYDQKENPLTRDLGHTPLLPKNIDTNQEMTFNVYFAVHKPIPLNHLYIAIADNIRRKPCKIRLTPIK